MAKEKLAYCAIHPGIGIARVGNSPDEYFVGPEVPGAAADPGQGFKDAGGRVKRQAARFRIYAFDAEDRPVQELTAADAEITWTVHLVNGKAAWARFAGFAAEKRAQETGTPLPLRNATVEDRSLLVVDPGPRSISGVNAGGPALRFDGGTFLGEEVPLGEIRTDEAGRLLVLGGSGRAGSVVPNNPIRHYANNDGWFDDTSDGPVTATVRLAGGKKLPVRRSSWAVVGPPDFAPAVENIVTLYDVMEEMAISQGWLPPQEKVSFTRRVYPLLARVAGYPWVHSPAARGHRPGARPTDPAFQGGEKVGDFVAPGRLAVLSDNRNEARPFREQVFARVRNPRPATPEEARQQASFFYMPQLSGDGGDLTQDEPDTWFSILPSQYAMLQRWAAGDFEADWQGVPEPPPSFDAIPVADQPAALDQAALEHGVGGPFFPGIEMTYLVRDPSYFSAPFRLRPDLAPGDSGKRMALPWQADFYKCQGFWWPAQRPDDVVTEAEYRSVLASYGSQDGHAAELPADLSFRRERWDRGVGDRLIFQGDAARVVLQRRSAGHNELVTEWSGLGFVVARRAPAGTSTFLVETERSPYAGLRDRDYFHIMVNIDDHPDFVPVARALAEAFLAQARQLQLDVALEDDLHPFPYTVEAFDARLDKIYNGLVDVNAVSDPRFGLSRPDLVELIRQTGPFNQIDGAWLQGVGEVGPIDEAHALLFGILADETGNGDVERNHSNVFTDLLHSVGTHPPAVRSRAYVDDPELLDSAFTAPLFQLVMSQFSNALFPEILGMTVYLEWEAVSLGQVVAQVEFHGINSHFYRLHVGIDNAADGHGAKAKEGVKRYLERVREEGGDAAVQQQWRRIWDGYVAFKTVGTMGEDFGAKIAARQQAPLANDVADMMRRKKRYGQLNHDGKTLAGNLINDLFEDPGTFMNALVTSGMILPGDPDSSPFFQLVSFTGPMYKVFTDDEIGLWREWTRSLSTAELTGPVDRQVVTLAVELADRLRAQGAELANRVPELAGPDPTGAPAAVASSTRWWLDQPVRSFMSALADPANGLVVPGEPSASRLVTELLADGTPLGDALGGVAPGTSHRRWRSIARDWIAAGCPLPTDDELLLLEPLRRSSDEVHAMAAAGPVPRVSVYSSREEVAATPLGRVLGMGTVH